jgi:hypothetical protein
MDELWLKLFKKAIDLIDSCATSGTLEPKWTFGGGTVLFSEFQHRHSKDIDIFLADAQYLQKTKVLTGNPVCTATAAIGAPSNLLTDS